MFVKKLQLSAIIGGVLAVLAMIGSLSQGEGLGKAFSMIPVCMLIALVGVFWFTRNMDSEGNEMQPTTSDQIDKLQRELRSVLQTAANYEARGEHATAGQLRSNAAVIESKLRRLGA